ncbi:hypothetical protein [Immundisolibacter sp.]|uniref:hypothetical protein n=1 Tax=Immundisolibacter sp. TaxID=1934948 RepID=UPI00356948CF
MTTLAGRRLTATIDDLINAPAPAGAHALAETLRLRHGDSVAAVLFYGSNFRRGDDREGLLDLYVLVDDCRAALGRRLPALACRLLPPNVYYIEMSHQDRTVRCKYAVLDRASFCRGMHAAQSYFWGRFGQPSGLLYARDTKVRSEVSAALAQAVLTLLGRAVPLLAPRTDEATWWAVALGACYAAELRPERPDAVTTLVREIAPWRAALTPIAAPLLGGVTPLADGYAIDLSPAGRRRGRIAWAARRMLGKTLNVARLIKAAFTFVGGADYLLWKVERHSGVRIETTPFLRRHPLLGIWGIAWRLWRRDGFR